MGFVLNQAIDNYEVLGIIDKPKAGITYKVRNRATGELESLRALPGATSRDPESAERLLREIRVHARLSHPNIVAFHDALEMDGHLVMTTEFVEGRTLAELCAAGPMMAVDAVHAIFRVLDGLEEAHALGIVHRGISAEHVIVGPDGAVKLGGFGLAKPAVDTHLTRVGSVVGDPRYISPEQVMGLAALDGRSDLYSVGVLLYQTLTGKVPFEGANDFDVLAAQVSAEPQPPSMVNPLISPQLDGIVLKALRKEPEGRFASAKEFRTALAGAATVAEEPPPPMVSRPHHITPQLFVQHNDQRLPLAPLAFGFFALAIGLAIFSWAAMH